MSWSGVDCLNRSVDGWGSVVNWGGVGNGSIVDWSRLVVDRLVVTNDVLGGDCWRVVWMTGVAHCYQHTRYHDLMNKQAHVNNKPQKLNFIYVTLQCFFSLNIYMNAFERSAYFGEHFTLRTSALTTGIALIQHSFYITNKT